MADYVRHSGAEVAAPSDRSRTAGAEVDAPGDVTRVLPGDCTDCCGGRDFCGGTAMCTEAASNVTVDLTGLTDALPGPIGNDCAAATLSAFGTTILVPGGFGSPFNAPANPHDGLWQFDQTWTGFFNGHPIAARLLITFFIGCIFDFDDLIFKIAVNAEVQLICDTGADDFADYGPVYFPRTGPFDCHGAFTLALGFHGSQFNWPATLTFQLP